MTYGRAFSLFSNVQGKARPNRTGRLLKERGTRRVQNLLIHSDIVLAGWRYMNQCSTLRCYKRTRCERDGNTRGRNRAEMHSCGVWHVCRVENNGTRHVKRQTFASKSGCYPFDTLNAAYVNFIRDCTTRCLRQPHSCCANDEVSALENLLPKFSERESG